MRMPFCAPWLVINPMTNPLNEFGLSPHQVYGVLLELSENLSVSKRQREYKLMAYLEDLKVVRLQKNRWQLVAKDRLALLLSSLPKPVERSVPPVMSHRLYLHHKTAAAWRGDSKADRGEALLPEQVVTKDEILRLRSFGSGLRLYGQDGYVIDADLETTMRTEVAITERLWLAISHVVIAQDSLVITVENLGAFVDFPACDGVVLVYSSGANFTMAAELIKRHLSLNEWTHFPDIDPKGIQIGRQLAKALGRAAKLWFPSFWPQARRRSMQGKSKMAWADILVPEELATLAQANEWIEQELLVIDQRFEAAIKEHNQSRGRADDVG